MSTWRKVLDTEPQAGTTVLRLALGGIMLPHGAQHLLGWFGGYGFGGTLKWMVNDVGFPAPLAAIAIVVEFLAPLALLLGLGGRVAALGLVGLMAGAASTHTANGFFMNWFGTLPAGSEGFEYHLLVIAMALAVVVQGSGAFSLDRWLTARQPNGQARSASFAMLLMALLLAACSDADPITQPVPHPPTVASVTVLPDTMTLLLGEMRELQARVRMTDGTLAENRPIAWSVDNPLVVQVNGEGRVVGQRTGEVRITASSGGRSGFAILRVVAPPAPVVARIEIRPGNIALNVGATRELRAHAFASDGTEILVPANEVEWISLAPAVATVVSNGTVTAVAPGATRVRATFMNVSAEANVTVPTPVPAAVDYRLANAVNIREYEVIRNEYPTLRFRRVLRLVDARFHLAGDERSYIQSFTVETWEFTIFGNGSSIGSLIDTTVTDDFGSAGTIAGVGDFVFHSSRNGATFTGRRSANSLETHQDVPGAIVKFNLVFNRI